MINSNKVKINLKTNPFPYFEVNLISSKDAKLIRDEILSYSKDNNIFQNGSIGRINLLHKTQEQLDFLQNCSLTRNKIEEVKLFLDQNLFKVYKNCPSF